MISGTLPNNTVWWISKDGKKVWIESGELEKQKFSEKGYNVVKDRIFSSKIKKQVGELASSRLERRLYKAAWIITLNTLLDVYPNLVSEIEKKTIEERNKTLKKKQTKSPSKKLLEENKIENKIDKENEIENKIEEKGQKLNGGQEEKKKISNKSYFDIKCPYVEWIKGEVNKNPELKILSENMKEKMGEEYLNMHDIRIYFGLKKILTEIGINIELGKFKGKSLLIMKKC